MILKKWFILVGFSLSILPILLNSTSSGSVSSTSRFQTILLEKEWRIQSSGVCREDGSTISREDFKADQWFRANIPSTVLAALAHAGEYKDLYFGRNLEKVSAERFEHSWWYRKVFDLTPESRQAASIRLIFEGINYRANVWLNGRQIASANDTAGCFRIFDFEILKHVKAKGNCLAVEIFPPAHDELSIGFVDWNQWPPDKNMGIWREVKIRTSGKVSIEHPHIRTKLNLNTLEEAFVTISAELQNHGDNESRGFVNAVLNGTRLRLPYRLNAGERKKVEFTPASHPELHIRNPRIWWPNHLGKPELYTAALQTEENNIVLDETMVRFGMREVSDYVNDEGHRGYKINGKKLLIKGAAWVDDMLLADTPQRVRTQMQYVRDLNLNAIRLEGFWGNNSLLYDLADELGILIMAGWSCHWEWNDYCNRPDDQYMSIRTPEDMELHADGYLDQVTWLRNHPSVFLWVFGSDKLLRPELEKKMVAALRELDPDRPILGSCKYKVYEDLNPLKTKDRFTFQTSEITGPTRVKMLGPYEYVAPEYWHRDREFGGAYGFNTETGPGAQPPVLESLKEMIPADKLWPINEEWDYHCARREFSSLKHFLKAFNNRYGAATSVESFAQMAQAASYEAVRPMFEAFRINKKSATGVIHWMLNSAWPKMVWQVYDYFLRPTGAYYGIRKACQPLSLVYNYFDNGVYLVNDPPRDSGPLKARITLFDFDGTKLHDSASSLFIKGETAVKILDVPLTAGKGPIRFLSMNLQKSSGEPIGDNFYWISSKPDVSDTENTLWYYTPLKEYADFTALRQLPPAKVTSKSSFQTEGDQYLGEITLENHSPSVAFFIELKVVRDKSNTSVVPAYWRDNYISLAPMESRTFTVTFSKEDLKGEIPVFQFSGVNVVK